MPALAFFPIRMWAAATSSSGYRESITGASAPDATWGSNWVANSRVIAIFSSSGRARSVVPVTDARFISWLGGKADVVMSDMAAASSGHKQTDHLRIIALCEAAAYFAFDVLEEGGTFVAKVLAGGAEGDLQKILKQRFAKVANVKPGASRADSSEKFVVASGFRG